MAHLDSDTIVQLAGYAIDDVSVVACEPPPDLVIIKHIMPGAGMLLPGQMVTYTLAFTNTSLAPATGVTIADPLPAGLVQPSFASNGAAIIDTGAQPPFQWAVEDLASGEGGTITVTARVDPTLSADLALSNTATITGTDDINLANNSAITIVQVLVPRVSLAPAGVIEGGSTTLTVTLDTPNPYAEVIAVGRRRAAAGRQRTPDPMAGRWALPAC